MVYELLKIILSSILAVILAFTGIIPVRQNDIPVMENVYDIPIEAETGAVINILNSKEDIAFDFQKLTEIYTSENPGVKITVQTISNPDDYRAAVRSRILSGDKLDLFHTFGSPDILELADNLEDLKSLGISTASPLDIGLPEDKSLAFPYSTNAIGIIANQHIFETNGININAVQSLEELDEAFKALWDIIKTEDLSETFPHLEAVTEFAASDKKYLAEVIQNIFLTDSFETKKSALSSEYITIPFAEDTETLLRSMAFYSTCSKWSELLGVSRRMQLEDGIAGGRIAAVIESSASCKRILTANPELEGKLTFLPIPNGKEKNMYIYSPVYWSVNKNSREQDKKAAADFLSWVYSSKEGAEFFTGQMGEMLPFANEDIAYSSRIYNQISSYLEAGEFSPALFRETPMGIGEKKFALDLQDYFTLEKTFDIIAKEYINEWYYLKT